MIWEKAILRQYNEKQNPHISLSDAATLRMKGYSYPFYAITDRNVRAPGIRYHFMAYIQVQCTEIIICGYTSD